ncbi:MAG: hypothetical protein D3910_29195 [Candidatus Electrothrix sp. ATG2]|nr:hypothetical protein [Candidatus Electrothrix sp. ATG2]
MSNPIIGNDKIQQVFSVFHDGIMSNVKIDRTILSFDVKILYLAQRVNTEFQKFHVPLTGCNNLKFITWPVIDGAEAQELRDPVEIFKPELDILSGNLKCDQVQVVCNQPSPKFNYCGGELYFSADFMIVLDEAGKNYTLEELCELSRGYWKDWSKKTGNGKS